MLAAAGRQIPRTGAGRSPGGSAALLAAIAAIAVTALAGCGSSVSEGARLSVHVGVGDPGGEAAARGAELALTEAGGTAAGVEVEIETGAEDPEGPWRQAAISAAGRAASEDSAAIAYLGETASEATAISVPITNEAGILQVATGPADDTLLREPGGSTVPTEFQPSGERTLLAPLGAGTGQPPIDPAFVQRYRDAYGRPPGLAGALGYEAMALVLDSIEAADDPLDRRSVIEAALAASNRDSPLGSYSIDAGGLGTLGR